MRGCPPSQKSCFGEIRWNEKRELEAGIKGGVKRGVSGNVLVTVEKDKKKDLIKEIEKSFISGGDIMPTIADELRIEGKIEAAEKMVEKGMTNADIRDITGLSIKRIAEILNKIQKK